MSYDFSLVAKYSNVKFFVKLLNLNEEDDCLFLADVMSQKNTQITEKNYHFSERKGILMCHLEWFTYEIENTSPYETQGVFQKG